ncbi:MAG: sensor histidine kinase, partial [Gaiellales bacterium]
PIALGGARRPFEIRDVIVAGVAFALTLGLLAGSHNPGRSIDQLGVVLAALSCFPLVAHRRSPLGVLAATTLASAALAALGYAMGPPFGPTVALFYVAADERSRRRVPETAAVVLGLFAVHVGATAVPHSGFPTTSILFGILVWGTAWVIGDQTVARRRRTADRVERARQAERDIERERRLAAAEERNRIARDLHDSAAHAINVILVHAGGARLLQERDPGAVRDALTTIEEVARETIGEIDRMVTALREDAPSDRAAGDVEPPTGLAALDTLTDRYRAAGLDIEVRAAGAPRALARGVDQAAYRILQESLTNAARHGTGGVALAEISYDDQWLRLDVSNPAVGAGEAGGHGIVGMRERAELLGGGLETGFEAGWFHVSAWLPYAGGEPGT